MVLIENRHADVGRGECGAGGGVKSGDENRWNSLQEFVEEMVDFVDVFCFSFFSLFGWGAWSKEDSCLDDSLVSERSTTRFL